MARWFTGLGLFMLLLLGNLQAVFGAEAPWIKVGLAVEQNEIQLTLNGTEQLFDLSEAEPVNLIPPSDHLVITAVAGGIFINNMPVGNGPLLLLDESSLLSWGSRCYRGEFLITVTNNRLNIINNLPIEDYLRGVLPGEIPSDWPMAVLKAQAVSSRTYTITTLGRHGTYDLCTGTHCQVYSGASSEKPSTDQAVAMTSGHILSCQGKPIAAFYHAAAGDFTVAPSKIWGTAASYLKPVVDWDQNSARYEWTKVFDWQEVQVMVDKSYPQIGCLRRINAVVFDEDNRVTQMVLEGDLDQVTILGEQFRSVTGIASSKFRLGLVYGPEPLVTLWWNRNLPFPEAVIANSLLPGVADLLKPAWDQPDPWAWLADKTPVKLIIYGYGWGHGVGLSQCGAKGMADNGFTMEQILEHYYPGTTLSN